MDPSGNIALKRAVRLSASIGSGFVALFLGIFAFLSSVPSLLAIFLSQQGLLILPWFVPAMIHRFNALVASS